MLLASCIITKTDVDLFDVNKNKIWLRLTAGVVLTASRLFIVAQISSEICELDDMKEWTKAMPTAPKFKTMQITKVKDPFNSQLKKKNSA